MELIRISDRKLKIMLTPTDMSYFEMNADRLGEDTEQMRRSFRMLMKEVRRKIAFELDDRRVSVQYFPSREGGCEMFISCSSPEEEKRRANMVPPEKKQPAKALRKPELCWRESAYLISGMKDLLNVCKRLQLANFQGKSIAYRDADGKLFLLLKTQTTSLFSLPEEFAFLAEYGVTCNPTQTKLYIMEHATLISENAVEVLAALA